MALFDYSSDDGFQATHLKRPSVLEGGGPQILVSCLQYIVAAEHSLAAAREQLVRHEDADQLSTLKELAKEYAPDTGACEVPPRRPSVRRVSKSLPRGASAASISTAIEEDKFSDPIAGHAHKRDAMLVNTVVDAMTTVEAKALRNFQARDSSIPETKYLILDQVLYNPNSFSGQQDEDIENNSTLGSLRLPNAYWALDEYSHPPSRTQTFLSLMRRANSRRCSCSAYMPTIPVVHPHSRRRLVWWAVGLCFVTWDSFFIPLFLAFMPAGSPEFFNTVSLIMTIYFMADVPLNFVTGFIDRRGVVVMKLSKVMKNYATSWMTLDVCVSVPWELLDASEVLIFSRSAKGVRYVRILRMIRLLRILRLLKVRGILENMEVVLESSKVLMIIMSLVRSLIMLLFCMHWSACAWWAIGTMEEWKFQDTWVSMLETLKGYDVDSMHMVDKYVWSLYFTMTTMTTVGYGDITPKNLDECLFTLVLLPLSTVVFGGLMGVCVGLVSNFNQRKRIEAEKKMKLAAYMHWRVVPWSLMLKIRRQMLYLWETKQDYAEYEVKVRNGLSPTLRQQLSYHIYGRVLDSAPFLSWMKDYNPCMRLLASFVSEQHFDVGDYLFRVGDRIQDIYVMIKGSVFLFLADVYEGDAEDVEIKKASRRTLKSVLTYSSFHRRDEKGIPPLPLPVYNFLTMQKMKTTVLRIKAPQNDDDILPIMSSQVFEEALDKLQDHSEKLLRATLRIQRNWRHKQAVRKRRHKVGRRGPPTPKHNKCNKNPGVLQHLQNRNITAPAFFGESCLWIPVEEWADPITHKYGARCQQRAEVVVIPRRAVRKVLDDYSPWLYDRLRFFADAVAESMNLLAPEDSVTLQETLISGETLHRSQSQGVVSMTAPPLVITKPSSPTGRSPDLDFDDDIDLKLGLRSLKSAFSGDRGRSPSKDSSMVRGAAHQRGSASNAMAEARGTHDFCGLNSVE